jgi:hypothetical protein
MWNGRLKKKRLLLLIALLLSICVKWYIIDIYLFTPAVVTIAFCILMQIDDKFIAMIHAKPIVYEDLTEEKAKLVYLVFIRLSVSISIVFVVDYLIIYYENQPLFQTVGIIGGMYNIYNKVESRLAKVGLLFTYYIIHKKNPYKQQEDQGTNNTERIVSIH